MRLTDFLKNLLLLRENEKKKTVLLHNFLIRARDNVKRLRRKIK